MSYPPPTIPLSPVLSGDSLRISNNDAGTPGPGSILENCNLLQVTSGRAAIALALEHCGVTVGDQVLVPAFHCESMISPVEWRRANPVYYCIQQNTKIDIEDIERKITDRTKAIIVTHYFGFIQDMASVAALCEQAGIVLIEDCAHAFFGHRDGRHVGTWGDYAIASSMKFFPVYDGGVLSSSKRTLNETKLEHPSQFFQIKSCVNVVQTAVRYGRLGILGKLIGFLSLATDNVWSGIKKLSGRSQSGIVGPSSSGGGYGLDESWIHKRVSWFTQQVIKHQRTDRIAKERRSNYLKLYAALKNLPNSHPLFDELPEGIVPLVFPLYVNDPDLYFDSLKRAGVPIWRFGEFLDEAITDEVCRNSVRLSKHTFQFPCHQELSDSEIDWMIDQVTTLITTPPKRT